MSENQPNTAPAIDKIAAALAEAQGAFPVIPKDSEVEVKNKEGKTLYKYKYADLTAIITATRPALSKNGISFTQGVVPGGFVTTLMHSSGQQLQTGYIPCNVPNNADMKIVAGIVTYVKRISLTAALGVSADEDVDAAPMEGQQGNQTAKGSTTRLPAKTDTGTPATQPPKPAPATKPPPQNAPATQATMDKMLDLMIDRQVHENSVTNLITKGYGFKSPPPAWVADEIMGLLQNEDCNDKTIEAKYIEVLKRREAAQKKGG